MKKRKTSAAATGDFEFCKVCNRHHQDGKRHKYFPKHLTSLSYFLDRFQSKLSDVRFFLKNPTVLLPQHATRNRLCSKAIRHLASDDHLKSWKSFLWKNGGGMDQVDSFVISEPELAEWERKCNMLPKEASSSSEASKAGATIYEPSNDIHNQTDSIGFNNSVDYFTMSTHGSNSSNGVVMPLHRYTNENHQVWASHMDQTVSFESVYHQNSVTSASQPGVQHVLSSSGLKHNAVEDMGNAHTGAPPPWLEPICNEDLVQGSRATLVKPSSQMSKKSRKLNPKRVGAAWAEKRKIEIELEKRGEISAEKIDESWLPNFGRVWQAGSRKDSKKEFEMEKQNVAVLSQSEMPIDIQPYVSKRMRTDGTSIG